LKHATNHIQTRSSQFSLRL